MDNWKSRLGERLSLFPDLRLDESVWIFEDPSQLQSLVRLLFEEGVPEVRFLNLLAVVDQGAFLELHHGFGSRVFGWELCCILRLGKRSRHPAESSSASTRLSAPSFQSFYPYQALQWKYLGELYGIQFGDAFEQKSCFLPSGWEGFPLRKDATPATEFQGFVSVRFQGRQSL